MAEGFEIEHMARWHGGPTAQFVKKRDTTGSIVDRVNTGFRPAPSRMLPVDRQLGCKAADSKKLSPAPNQTDGIRHAFGCRFYF